MLGGAVRKAFELSGVAPLGVFVLVHVTSYGSVLFGRRDFGVAGPDAFAVLVLEAFLVWLPLAVHGMYGAWLSAQPLTGDTMARRNSVILRVTGIFALIFIALHALWLRLPILRGERAAEDAEQMLIERLSATAHGVPLVAALHLLGLGAVLLHLALGLPRFLSNWGVVDSSAARKISAIGCGVLFVVGAATVVELATGSAIP